jgi:hypothetical protein
MYPSTTPAVSCEQEPSEAVRDFARHLRIQADVVDAVRERLRVAESIGWESPAGRNFRSYLIDRAAGLGSTAALLREAAVSMEGYGVTLQTSEAMNGSRG